MAIKTDAKNYEKLVQASVSSDQPVPALNINEEFTTKKHPVIPLPDLTANLETKSKNMSTINTDSKINTVSRINTVSKIDTTNKSDRSDDTVNSGSHKKKKKTFKKVTALALPPGMDQFVKTIQDPLKQIESMMQDEDKLIQEDQEAQTKFHKMDLFS
jgi:hypothetical protein